jgi:hypothetical protein
MIVLDANILIRAVLGRRVRQLIDTYAGQGVRFFAPDVAFDDAEKYLPPLLKKRGKPHDDFSASLEYLRNIIEAVTPELYAVFESEARQRLRGAVDEDLDVDAHKSPFRGVRIARRIVSNQLVKQESSFPPNSMWRHSFQQIADLRRSTDANLSSRSGPSPTSSRPRLFA